MESFIIIFFITIFGLLGTFLALNNWYCIVKWVILCRRNPRLRNRSDGVTPLFGGLFLSIALMLLGMGFPHLFPIKLVWLGFVIDYGSLPSIFIIPFLDLLLKGSKGKKGSSKPREPYCREIQIDFPLLLETETELRLICSATDMPPRNADFLQEACGSTLYSETKCQKIAQVQSPQKANWWNFFRHRNDVNFWQIEVKYTIPRPYKLDKLRKLIACYIREDDDVWTQFHEAADLQRLLKSCTTFREVLALGCLAGWWESPADTSCHLPQLTEATITEDDIRQAGEDGSHGGDSVFCCTIDNKNAK